MESNSWTHKKQSSRFFHFSSKMVIFFTSQTLMLHIFDQKMKIFEFFVTKILKVSSVWYWFIQHKPLYINFRHCVRWKETPTTRSSPGDYYDLIRKSQFSSKSQKNGQKTILKNWVTVWTPMYYGMLRSSEEF